MSTPEKRLPLYGIASHWPLPSHDLLLELIELAPRAAMWHTQLTKAAYRNGLQMGLNFDVGSREWRDNPYRERMSNFHTGRNDVYAAWNAGSLDGQRVRMLAKTIDATTLELDPPLLHREYRVLKRYQTAGCV